MKTNVNMPSSFPQMNHTVSPIASAKITRGYDTGWEWLKGFSGVLKRRRAGVQRNRRDIVSTTGLYT